MPVQVSICILNGRYIEWFVGPCTNVFGPEVSEAKAETIKPVIVDVLKPLMLSNS